MTPEADARRDPNVPITFEHASRLDLSPARPLGLAPKDAPPTTAT